MKSRITRIAILLLVACLYPTRPLFSQSVTDSAGCNNFSGYTEADSVFGIDWFAIYQTIESDLSSDGLWLATSMININYPAINMFYDGVVIVDIKTRQITKLLNSIQPKWSPDGTRLLLQDYIYVPERDSVIMLPTSGSQYDLFDPQWSKDGESIYYSNPSGQFKSDKYGNKMMYVGFKNGAKPLSDSILVFIPSYFRQTDRRHYVTYNMNTTTADTIFTHALDGISDIYHESLSKRRRFFAADIRYYGVHIGEWRSGLGMYDFEQNRFKEILQDQAFRSFYYPSWSSDSTLLISFICHNDSSYTTWEIDTNGVFLRKLTDKSMVPQLTEVRTAPSKPGINAIFIYPCPTKGDLFLECTLRRADTYSLAVYDILGKEIRRIWNHERFESGRQTGVLSTRSLPPGIYLVRLDASHEATVYSRFIKDK
jgi:hypothetical protein